MDLKLRLPIFLRFTVRGLLAATVVLLAAYLGLRLWASGRLASERAERLAAVSLAIEAQLPEIEPDERNGSHALDAAAALLARRQLEDRQLSVRELRLDRSIDDGELVSLARQRLARAENRLALEVVELFAGTEKARSAEGAAEELVWQHSDYTQRRLGALRLANLLELRAFVALHEGRPDAAYHDVRLALRIADWLQQESPMLIAWLLGTAVARGALENLEECHQIAPPAAAIRGDLRSDLERLRPRDAAWALRRERLFTQAQVWMVHTDPLSVSRRLWIMPGTEAGWLDEGSDFYERFAELASRPPHARGELKSSSLSSPLRPAADILLPNLWDAVHKSDVLRMRIELAAVALAWEDARAARGEIPGGLDELVPDHLAEVPRDLFRGEPLHQRRDGGQCIVYSVGPNLEDEGGIDLRTPQSGDADDVAWRLPCGPAPQSSRN